MPRVVHFEISADDPDRAGKFYGEVFGWETKKWEGPIDYWLVTTGPEDQPGIDGGIQRRQEGAQPVVNTIDVPSVDKCLQKIQNAGGRILVPKTAVPGVGWIAYFADTEGNVFGIMQGDESAE